MLMLNAKPKAVVLVLNQLRAILTSENDTTYRGRVPRDHQPMDELRRVANGWELWELGRRHRMILSTDQTPENPTEITRWLDRFNNIINEPILFRSLQQAELPARLRMYCRNPFVSGLYELQGGEYHRTFAMNGVPAQPNELYVHIVNNRWEMWELYGGVPAMLYYSERDIANPAHCVNWHNIRHASIHNHFCILDEAEFPCRIQVTCPALPVVNNVILQMNGLEMRYLGTPNVPGGGGQIFLIIMGDRWALGMNATGAAAGAAYVLLAESTLISSPPWSPGHEWMAYDAIHNINPLPNLRFTVVP